MATTNRRPIAVVTALITLACCAFSAAAAAPPRWAAGQGQFISAVASLGGRTYVATEDHGLWFTDGTSWTPLPTGDVVDDSVRAMAVDGKQRLWVGHGRHGVSVFNGKDWKNYDVPDGPLGHRVWRIAMSPLDGDVWMATDLGLCRYSIEHDSWSYTTRGQGLPSDQIGSLAFDGDGTLYAGTQSEGLAIATANDNYAHWRGVRGPDRLPVTASGDELPSNLINDVLVCRSSSGGGASVIVVGTCGGLAISRDRGTSWTFYRGVEFAQKVRNRTGGPPADWDVEANASALLTEDYVAALAQDAAGHLWVGYQRSGFDVINVTSMQRLTHVAAEQQVNGKLDFIRCIAAMEPQTMLLGTWGQGLATCATGAAGATADRPPGNAPPAEATAAAAALPSPARVKPSQYDALHRQLASLKPQPLTAAVYLGDDWATRGDGAGRYGCQQVMFPFYGLGGWASGYHVDVSVGPHQVSGGPYYYFADPKNVDERVLYLPNSFKRTQGEWNDGSFDSKAYPNTYEGPDLWLAVTVPPGVHRLTLFFINFDGHTITAPASKKNRYRDYSVAVMPWTDGLAEADFATPLAQTRVSDFYDPVYKQFLLAGGQKYRVKIARNYSFAAKLSAIFLDRMKGAAPQDIDSLPHPLLDPQHWGPPPAPARHADSEAAAVSDARDLWNELDDRYDDAAAAAFQLPLRLQAYRLAADNAADPALLANWRWRLALWDEAARLEFSQQMDAGFDRTVASNPQVADKKHVPMVEQYKAAHP